MRGAARGGDGRARRRGRARAPRRDHPRPRRQRASCRGWRIAASSCSAVTASWRASDACASASRLLSARRAVVLAPGTRAAMPPIAGLREAEPWTQPRGDDERGDPRVAARARRRRRRGRAGAGVRDAGRARDDRRGARAPDRARGAVRLRARAAKRSSATASRSCSARRRRRSSARRRCRGPVTLELEDGRSFDGRASCSWRSGASRAPTRSAWSRSG